MLIYANWSLLHWSASHRGPQSVFIEGLTWTPHQCSCDVFNMFRGVGRDCVKGRRGARNCMRITIKRSSSQMLTWKYKKMERKAVMAWMKLKTRVKLRFNIYLFLLIVGRGYDLLIVTSCCDSSQMANWRTIRQTEGIVLQTNILCPLCDLPLCSVYGLRVSVHNTDWTTH